MFRIVAAAMVLAAGCAQAADVKLTHNTAGEPIISLTGMIVAGDAAKVDGLLATQRVVGIRLDSPGGNIYTALEIADRIAAARVPAIVMQGAECASACAVIFMCSPERHAHITSRIGVHSAVESVAGKEAEGEETAVSFVATMVMARRAAKCGASPVIIAAMVTTPASEGMYWLTWPDLDAIHVHLWSGGRQVAGR